MNALDSFIEKLPPALGEDTKLRWQRLWQACEGGDRDWFAAQAADPERAARLGTLLACSPAAAEICQRHPGWLPAWDADGELDGAIDPASWPQRVQAATAVADEDDAALAQTLRQYRNRAWLRSVWRDLNRLADTNETTRDLSLLAEACIVRALDFHHTKLCAEWGEPRSRSGEAQQLVVIAMGKLGARELNLSSDVDLLFAFPEGGATSGDRSVDNQQFFARLGQRLIKALDARTVDGFVFRVDMRLRPYGQSGPLVMSFDAVEEYYQDQGRDWERYAMIKARCIAGDIDAGAALLERLRPFVYRRYVDYSAIESLRDMKALIRREVQLRNLQHNIKLGPGGIREVEFIAQCFQLIRGGNEHSLQQRSLPAVLAELRALNYLPAGDVDELLGAYYFLRDTEHALQAWQDRQTQDLPTEAAACAALAWAMGCGGDWVQFQAQLAGHRERVADHFSHIIAAPEHDDGEQGAALARWQLLLRELSQEAAEAAFAGAGHEDPPEAARRLLALLGSAAVQRMQSIGRERLYAFLPLLLEALSEASQPTRTLMRLLPLVEAVLRRTAYLVLLVENPGALGRLVQLCDASVWIARQLAMHPVLLDELLDARSLYTVPERAGLHSELRQQMLRIAEDDLEAQMEGLRYFKLAHVLRVAVCEVTGTLPLMKVSDYLTAIAEVVVEYTVELAWLQLAARHGVPAGCEDGIGSRFVVVGYGKLGGIELGYGSDLDMVFVHDAASGATDGERSLDNTQFFTRLGQRMIHLLTAHTRLGKLYEVDMRLRPSGESGLLVSSFKALADYQRERAWTWEHQALVRARVVAGDDELAQRFAALRREQLGREREPEALRAEVLEMRRKMREHLLPKGGEDVKNALFDLKQGRGGIVDIEFMVQYAVLAWSQRYPSLATNTDNIRILEALQREQLLAEVDVQALIAAYKTYRSHAHRLNLQEEKGLVPLAELGECRDYVSRIWQQLMGEDPTGAEDS